MARGPLVTDEEALKWNEQIAAGVSISQVAKEAKRTYNTVKRYIGKPAANDVPKEPEAA